MKKKRVKRALYFHFEQQHLDSPKNNSPSNHEKVNTLRFCRPFRPSISQHFASVGPSPARGCAHGSSHTGIYSLGPANPIHAALQGSGVVHLHVLQVSCSTCTRECIKSCLLVSKPELLGSWGCVSILQSSLLCDHGAIPTTGALKGPKAKEK